MVWGRGGRFAAAPTVDREAISPSTAPPIGSAFFNRSGRGSLGSYEVAHLERWKIGSVLLQEV